MIKKVVKKVVSIFSSNRDKIRDEAFEPGHYYSVIPSLAEVKAKENELFSKKDDLEGISLNHDQQVSLLEEFKLMSEEKEFSSNTVIRYNFDNPSFSFDDAPVLHYMLRYIRPKKVIEIGSGHSSALMLDTFDLFIENQTVDFTFIDINLDRLKRNLLDKDYANVKLIEKPVQTVENDVFKSLNSGDLLFIDSSHVSKIGSDLNTIIFKILPLLKSGVYIHFHDVRFPFEYSKELVYNKVFWNEAYLLRSFLMYNERFEITFWLNYLLNSGKMNDEQFNFLPLDKWDEKFNNSQGNFSGAGGSIYIRKK